MSLAPSKDLPQTGNSRVLLRVGNCAVFVSAEHGWLAAQQWPRSTQLCTSATCLEEGIPAKGCNVQMVVSFTRESSFDGAD